MAYSKGDIVLVDFPFSDNRYNEAVAMLNAIVS